ncbi:MAG TPA: hypothetical protein VMH04_15755 [Candidatus Solibacter sp.]|nr:hypothetical protein [Candidatus Solibacter sp.]
MKKRILLLAALLWSGLHLISCNSYNSSNNKGPTLHTRVLASQGVSSATLFGDLVFIDGANDTLARISPVSAGSSPGLMAISPTRNTLLAFDAATNSNTVFAVNTVTEAGISNVRLPGPTTSMVVPTAALVGYAAVPSATVNGYSFVGGVEDMNLSNGAITTTIALTNAKTVISDGTGARLLVFNDSDSVAVVSPIVAAPPVDTSCLSGTPNSVCTIVNGFDKPVYGIVSGSTAYIFNCGPECNGTQAGVAVLDLNSLTITNTIPLDAATWGFLNGSTLYVAGTSPTVNDCSGQTTAATTCGRLSIVDLGSQTLTSSIAITDGTHDRMDMSVNGQLFIGSYNCTNIGNVNNPSGEVRGCLTIYNTNTASVIIPPDNGDVTGLQSFTSRDVEYVAENGVLRVYDTTKDIVLVNDFVPQGEINIVGYVGDIKAIDFF